MGTKRSKRSAGGVAGALFTPVQQRVLGLLFGQAERRFRSGEVIRLAGSGTGAVHRQLQRLAAAGLLTVTREGNQKLYQANAASPVFAELRGLVEKTVGLVEPLREALAPLAGEIAVAFVYGSVAAGRERAESDVDLLVLSDRLEYPEVYQALEPVERRLARPVNPTVMKPGEWKRKRAARDSFARRVAGRPRLLVLGSEDVLG
jgi:predicted nucleotidyltransferase